jgi:uncharacterized protein (TIGR02466 family)
MAEIIGDEPAEPTEPKLQEFHYFTSAIYQVQNTEFLETVSAVADEYLVKVKKQVTLNEIYPVYMTDNFMNDPRLADFSKFILDKAWGILNHQGYNMDSIATIMNELWCQEHEKHSGQDEHIHGLGNQISGFYFLECPKNGSIPVFHDPRPAKKYANIIERDMSRATTASIAVNFKPEPGMILFANSWLPHAFTKNGADAPSKFIHFNIGLIHKLQSVAVDNSATTV